MSHLRSGALHHIPPEAICQRPDRANLLPELMYQRLFAEGWNICDTREELALLRFFAEQCDHVTEFGCRDGTSTIALIAAQPAKVVSYDIVACNNERVIRAALGRAEWEFCLRSSTGGPIEPTDLLFIDSLHTYAHVRDELAQHHKSVRKFIAFHDTVTCWKKDEHGQTPGIGQAIDEFMEEWRDEWRLRLINLAQHGFMVLQREAFEDGTVPGLAPAKAAD